MFISEAYAQTAGAPAGGLDSLSQFLPLILIFVVFYFLLFRPQQKKAKAHREMISQVRRGDKVLTQGGIIGQVNKVIDDAELLVEIAEGVRVRVTRGAISEVLAKTGPATSGAKEDGEAVVSTEAPKTEAKDNSLLGRFFGKK